VYLVSGTATRGRLMMSMDARWINFLAQVLDMISHVGHREGGLDPLVAEKVHTDVVRRKPFCDIFRAVQN
jgi:hypothetical protein